MNAATGVRRILAVFIDLLAYSVVWGLIGVFAGTSANYLGLAAVFVLDVVLTAVTGASAGRWLAGIRVARVGGGRPGFAAAVIRTALTFSTGWAGLLSVTLLLAARREIDSDRGLPARMWWDAAAGTRLITAR